MLTTPCHAGDFWLLAGKPDGSNEGTVSGAVLLIDMSTLIYGTTERKVWTYFVTARNDEITNVSGLRNAYRCDQLEYSGLQLATFDPKTYEVTSTENQPEGTFRSPISGTLIDAALKFVCAQKQGQKVVELKELIFVNGFVESLSDMGPQSVAMLKSMKDTLESHKAAQ
jgi:hypothetical protein